jgi:hypothetical protein
MNGYEAVAKQLREKEASLDSKEKSCVGQDIGVMDSHEQV